MVRCLFRWEPKREPQGLAHPLEEQRDRQATLLMLQYQRHGFVRSPGDLTKPLLIPNVPRFKLDPAIVKQYEADRAKKSGAKAPTEVDAILTARRQLLEQQAQRFDACRAKPYTHQSPFMTNPSSSPREPRGRFQNRAGSPDKSERFKPSRSRSLWLHENDQAILQLVDRCRFLDSRQLRLTLGRDSNDRAFSRRLRDLFDAQYLDRPEAQLNRWMTKGQPTMHYVYALGIEGHKLLYPELHEKGAPATDWRLRNRRAGHLYIDHRLGVAEAMLSFVLAGEELGLQMAVWRDGTAFHKATGLPQYIGLTTNTGDVDVPLNPDAYFVLAAGDRNRDRDHFFLEVDRGTEPIARATYHRTSILQKLAAYWRLYSARIAERKGIPSFRVLTVTNSETRVENMRALARAIDRKERGSALFLFTTADNITLDDPPPSLTAPIWFTPVAGGAPRPLIA